MRVAKLQQDFCSPGTVGRGQIRILGQRLGRSVMSDGLRIGAALLRNIAGRDPMGEGRTEITGLLVVKGQQLRLARADKIVVEFLQCGCNTLVADLTTAAEQARIGGIAGQCVFERVDVAATAHQQAGVDELGQGGAERSLVHVEDGRQQPRRELTADCGADLRDLFYRCHAVETGHERSANSKGSPAAAAGRRGARHRHPRSVAVIRGRPW